MSRLTLTLAGLVSAGMLMSATPPHASGQAAVNGTRLYYEISGTGSPLVLISGGGTLDRRQWDGELDVLAARFRVVRYDIRGIGRSARPTGEFSHHEDLRALLDFLHITRAVVCGVSFGAAIAVDFALDHANMVGGVILAGPGLSSDKKASVESALALSALAKKEGFDRAVDLITGMPSFVSPGNRSARRRMRDIYRDNRDVFDASFPLVTLWQPAMPPASERLTQIKAPTLVVVGGHDTPAIAANADRLASSIAGAQKVVIAGAGHMVNMDAPVEFCRAVLAFLHAKVAGY
jgi:3-oxoadipate enol-lactonase